MCIRDRDASNASMNTAAMDVFQGLIRDLDAEGRYLFLNAVANQLRFPNAHTHYFSCALLYMFAEAGSELAQEQITRVLLERLIVNRPHPWGLLITFIELIKNPRYNFWAHSFTRCAPDIERLVVPRPAPRRLARVEQKPLPELAREVGGRARLEERVELGAQLGAIPRQRGVRLRRRPRRVRNLGQEVHLEVGRERVRQAHVARERAQDEVPHLDAVGRDDVAQRVVVLAEKLREVVQQDEQEPQRAAVEQPHRLGELGAPQKRLSLIHI